MSPPHQRGRGGAGEAEVAVLIWGSCRNRTVGLSGGATAGTPTRSRRGEEEGRRRGGESDDERELAAEHGGGGSRDAERGEAAHEVGGMHASAGATAMEHEAVANPDPNLT